MFYSIVTLFCNAIMFHFLLFCDAGALGTKASKRGPEDQNRGKSVLKQKNRFKVDLKQIS